MGSQHVSAKVLQKKPTNQTNQPTNQPTIYSTSGHTFSVEKGNLEDYKTLIFTLNFGTLESHFQVHILKNMRA